MRRLAGLFPLPVRTAVTATTGRDASSMGARGPIISSICARHFSGPNVATIYGTIFATNALGAAFGSFMGGVLHDLTGGYRVGLAFSLAFIAPCLFCAVEEWKWRRAQRNAVSGAVVFDP